MIWGSKLRLKARVGEYLKFSVTPEVKKEELKREN